MLFFSTGDEPTDKNLQRLDHLADNTCYGNAERMHDWLSAVIESKQLLPRVAAKHFTGFYHLGDQHYHMSAKLRDETWSKLGKELRRHVDAAYADPLLQEGGPDGPPDVSDRPQSLGERVGALARQLGDACEGSSEFNSILAEIEAIAVGDIKSDVQQLRSLLSRKRREPDHDYWVARHISHMRLIACQQHHLLVR